MELINADDFREYVKYDADIDEELAAKLVRLPDSTIMGAIDPLLDKLVDYELLWQGVNDAKHDAMVELIKVVQPPAEPKVCPTCGQEVNDGDINGR
jgi:hypothetical protein